MANKVVAFLVISSVLVLCGVADCSTAVDPDVINTCFIQAGYTYGIHPNVLWAIAKVESGFNLRAINKNANGTFDIGIMQINSSWLPTLKRYGVISRAEDLIYNPCLNIYVGAWVLAQCISKYGYNWTAVGCYNAITPEKRVKYARKVWRELSRVHAQ